MACRLSGPNPLSRPVMTSHQSHTKEQTSVHKKYENFSDEIALQIIVYNFATISGHPFVQASLCWRSLTIYITAQYFWDEYGKCTFSKDRKDINRPTTQDAASLSTATPCTGITFGFRILNQTIDVSIMPIVDYISLSYHYTKGLFITNCIFVIYWIILQKDCFTNWYWTTHVWQWDVSCPFLWWTFYRDRLSIPTRPDHRVRFDPG